MSRSLQICLFIVSFGCTTTSIEESLRRIQRLPPPAPSLEGVAIQEREQFLKNYFQKENEIEAKWWSQFQLGVLYSQSDRPQACSLFTNLAREHQFPLRDISDLHRLLICETDEAFSFEQYLNLSERKPWLRDLALDVALKSAERQKDLEGLSEVLYEKSRHSKFKTEKEGFLLRALDTAREINDETVVRNLETQLHILAPRLKPDEAPPLTVANDFKNVRDYNNAKIYYEKHFTQASSFDDKLIALQGLRTSNRLAGKKADALKVTLQIKTLGETNWKSTPNPTTAKQYLDAVTLWARAVWTEGNSDLASKALLQAEKKLRGQTPLEELYWLLGRMADEKQDFTKALEYYNLALKSPTSGTASDKVRWAIAWQNFKNGQYELARLHFHELAQSTKATEFDRYRYMYWEGSAQKKLGQPFKETYLSLAKSDSVGYYGLLAQNELKIESTVRAQAIKPWVDSSVFKNDSEKIYLEWLLAVGQQTIAQYFLTTKADDLKSRIDVKDEQWTELLHYFARSGKYLDLFRYLNTLQPIEKRESLLQQNHDIYFPKPFAELVKPEAEHTLVPTELIYAIMRQESAFDPAARSPADALGLMQILPNIAAQHLAKENLAPRAFNAEDLYDPGINIKAGSRLLRSLLKRFNNNFILAVAAYNSSPEAVDRWIKSRHRDEPLEFIEEIPYEETKGYVKLVLRNFAHYSLSSNARGPVIPPWCLQPIQSSAH